MTALAGIFRVRLLNLAQCSSDVCWDDHLVTLLQKKGFANRVRDFRPIAVLPVLYKVYSGVILKLASPVIINLSSRQFAFRPGYQAHEIVYTMRSLIEKSLEWQDALFILGGDAAKAYDYARLDVALQALTDKKVPKVLPAARRRELRLDPGRFGLRSSRSGSP